MARDGYLISKALAYAILAIDRLPPPMRESSDQRGMRELLKRYVPDDLHRQGLLDEVLSQMTGKPHGQIKEARERFYAEHPDKRPPREDETVVRFPGSDDESR
jgi:hypothetical protein